MATATKWKITDWTQTEEEGVVVALTLVMRVDDLDNTHGDNRTLQEALNTSGVPVQGDKAPGNTNLVLHRRTPRPVIDTPTSVEIICEYKTIADFENAFLFSGGTSLSQEQTDKDINGNRISLSYTYPNDYPVEELRGEVYTTSADEPVLVPKTTLTATGSLYVDYPTQVSHEWVWHVNSTYWAGWPQGYWLCTNCDFTPRDVGIGRAKLWKFSWTFELNPRSWEVISQITDPNTGRVPADVVAGVGVKSVEWYRLKNFNQLFPA